MDYHLFVDTRLRKKAIFDLDGVCYSLYTQERIFGKKAEKPLCGVLWVCAWICDLCRPMM